MPNIPVKNCCGCTACYAACPQKAITMEPDFEGFLYPAVNAEMCCECGLCERVCPLLSPLKLPEEFAACAVARTTKEEVLQQSTSGGFVDVLCEYITETCDGVAVGVAFDESFVPVHKIACTYEEAKAFRNSKYAQSELGDTFTQIKNMLKQNQTVLFIGTPCQVGGLKTYLQTDYENLYTVDLVCRSIPSPKLWKEYLNFQEKKYKSKIKSLSCRKKTYGYHRGTLEIEFENGKRYRGSNRVDYYMKAFHKDICSRPSCYACGFKTKHRCSDFTVFDCWKPHLVTNLAIVDDDKGYSNVLVHTPKGEKLLYKLTNVVMHPSDSEKLFCVMGSMVDKTIFMQHQRKEFYKDLEKSGFERTAKKYVPISTKDRLIEGSKPIRYFWKKKK